MGRIEFLFLGSSKSVLGSIDSLSVLEDSKRCENTKERSATILEH